MIAQRVDDALNEEISDIQVNNKEFRINNDPGLVIGNSKEALSIIRSVDGIESVVERVVITGMANSAYKSTGVQIVGIDPENEKKIFTIYKKIIPGTGDYFEKESKYNLALIGEDLAKEMNIVRYAVDTSNHSTT